jgi:hypothetical protein
MAEPIQTLVGGASGRDVEQHWNLVCSDGTTLFRGSRIRAVFSIPADPGSTKNAQIINRAAIPVPDGRFNVAFAYHKDTMTEPYYGPMWLHMQMLVDVLLQPQFPPQPPCTWYISYFNRFSSSGSYGDPGYVANRQKFVQLLNDLADPGTRNFYFHGHGHADFLTDQKQDRLTPGATTLERTEVAAALGNSADPISGVVAAHPYRFVFLNACETARDVGWARAFGIFPSVWWEGDATSIEQAGYRGPQAFVGWAKKVAGPDFADEWDDTYPSMPYKGYGTMIEEFYAAWMSGVPLIQCVARASDSKEYAWPLPVPANRVRYTGPASPGGPPVNQTGPLIIFGNSGITRCGVAPGY